MRSFCCLLIIMTWPLFSDGQSWKLTPENIDSVFRANTDKISQDPFRPGFHLTPFTGCMGDPNGGIYYQGYYHIFYGLHPFAFHPGGWFWAHARSRDLLQWELLPPRLTPAFELGLNAVGSGSTIITKDGKKYAFYSQSKKGPMEFWRAEFNNHELSEWSHHYKKPILTLDHPGLPSFDGFWRDPFVFNTEGRTFLIACADLFDQDFVPVPIFEAKNGELTDWSYQGILFTVPKHKYRNLEVPEIRPIGDKWIFMASTDAPIDRVNYFLGDLDLQNLKFHIDSEGIIDYSGHYYAQETMVDDKGDIYLMAWLPGWDREWLPYYMNHPLKNSNPGWNGCFALPRQLSLRNGRLVQQPVDILKMLRKDHFKLHARELPVSGPTTAVDVVEDFQGNQMEIKVKFDLLHASFCGINVLADKEGNGGLPIVWSGNMLNVDGVLVPLEHWKPGEALDLQIFVDQKFVEVFVNKGQYCISRQVREENVKGPFVAITSLGGTARLLSLEGWKLDSMN